MGTQSENNQTAWGCVLHLIGWEDGVTFWTNYRVKLSKTKAVLDYFRKSIQSQELSFEGQRLVNIYRGGGGGRGGGRKIWFCHDKVY